ncbi:hypothetical protein ACIPXV_26060 [Streptomyces libani]|uniref:hypothetical protein n=1 Tax=Streptomyces nigrescens TaxID=1920 RepID=UPI00381044DC
MTTTTTTSVTFAGHAFDVEVDQDFAVEQRTHLHSFVPEAAPAPPCGRLSSIRIRYDRELFADRTARLQTVQSRCVEPFRGEPYLRSRVGDVDWWRPHPRSHLPQDHLYVRDSTGRLHIVLHPDAHRGERYLLRIVREVVMRCGEDRGWTAFHAAAASIDGSGVLIAGPTTAGKTTVLAALACHRRADLVASDRAMLTQNAADVIGVPLSIRIAGGTLSALTPREALPPHRVLPRTFGTDQKASCTPRDSPPPSQPRSARALHCGSCFCHGFATMTPRSASSRCTAKPPVPSWPPCAAPRMTRTGSIRGSRVRPGRWRDCALRPTRYWTTW